MSPELVIITINLIVIGFAYFWLYPRVGGSDWRKIVNYDFLASLVGVAISASLFTTVALCLTLFLVP